MSDFDDWRDVEDSFKWLLGSKRTSTNIRERDEIVKIFERMEKRWCELNTYSEELERENHILRSAIQIIGSPTDVSRAIN